MIDIYRSFNKDSFILSVILLYTINILCVFITYFSTAIKSHSQVLTSNIQDPMNGTSYYGLALHCRRIFYIPALHLKVILYVNRRVLLTLMSLQNATGPFHKNIILNIRNNINNAEHNVMITKPTGIRSLVSKVLTGL